MATILDDLKDSATLDDLYRNLDTCHIQAGWAKDEPSLWDAPRKSYQPMHWSWDEGNAALSAAGRLVDTELAERRNLILFNPVEGNRYATVRTMICAYQMILPGEIARSHRHTPNALRMVLEGEGAYTVVDGERLDMHVNDVLLTPNWHWHGHGSESDGPCSWLDCLDVPTTHLLEPMFFEPHPEHYEPIASRPSRSPYIFPGSTFKRTSTARRPIRRNASAGASGSTPPRCPRSRSTCSGWTVEPRPARCAPPPTTSSAPSRAPARPSSTANSFRGAGETSSPRPPGAHSSTTSRPTRRCSS